MLDLIKSALDLGGPGASSSGKQNPNIELLASVLLLEAGHSDHECTDAELDHVVETIQRMFGLSREQVDELVEFAHAERREMVDVQQITRQINDLMDRPQKLALLEAVWRIVYTDGQVDKHEEGFARKLANLLWLEHRDFIDAKLTARKDVLGEQV